MLTHVGTYDMFCRSYSKLRNFGVNIVLIWFKYNFNYNDVDIWCGEISFEIREEKCEVWGTIEWSEVVATLDHDIYKFEVLYSASVNV